VAARAGAKALDPGDPVAESNTVDFNASAARKASRSP
jgi:hypothetical protein